MKAKLVLSWDPILGLDFFIANRKIFKAHKVLETMTKRFERMQTNTMRVRALGQILHITIEPENLKTIQAIDFKSWSLGTRRKVRCCRAQLT
jgi:hypothetical protein